MTDVPAAWWVGDILAQEEHGKVFGISAGFGCVDPATRIYTGRGLVPIADIKPLTPVLSWNEKSNQFELELSSGAFPKGKENLYRVVTQQGEFVAAGFHRVFSANSEYVRVEDLCVGQLVASCEQCPLLTNSAYDSKSCRLSGENSNRKLVDLTLHCEELSRLCDPLLRWAVGIGQAFSQPLACALGCGQLLVDMDGPSGLSLERTRLGQSLAHASSRGFLAPAYLQSGVWGDQICLGLLERILLYLRKERRFRERFGFHRSTEQRWLGEEVESFERGEALACEGLSVGYTRILAIERLPRKSEFWDLQVLNNNNYVTEDGAIHHNSGKTHGGAQWHDCLARGPNKRAEFSGWMEPTYQLIKTAAIPTYRRVLESYGLDSGRDYEIFESSPIRLRYRRSGHQVLFVSGDKPLNIAAFELSHASIDEAGACKGDAMRNFRTRVRSPQAERRQNLIFGAPQGVTEFAEEFDSDTLPDWVEDGPRKFIHTKKDFTRYVVWTDDNPFLPPDYIQNLVDTYGHNPNLIKSYRYGLFCPLVEGACYSNYLPQKHDIENVDASPYDTLYVTWDFNANPLAWVSLQQVRFEEGKSRVHRYVAIDEASSGIGQLEEAIVEFALKHPVREFRDTPIEIFGDSSGHRGSHRSTRSDYRFIEDNLRELGYRKVSIRAFQSNPLETASVDAVQRLFSNDLLFISKRCVKLKKSLLATTWKKGIRKIDKPAGETWTHHSDSLKYFCYQEAREFTGKAIKTSGHIW